MSIKTLRFVSTFPGRGIGERRKWGYMENLWKRKNLF